MNERLLSFFGHDLIVPFFDFFFVYFRVLGLLAKLSPVCQLDARAREASREGRVGA